MHRLSIHTYNNTCTDSVFFVTVAGATAAAVAFELQHIAHCDVCVCVFFFAESLLDVLGELVTHLLLIELMEHIIFTYLSNVTSTRCHQDIWNSRR